MKETFIIWITIQLMMMGMASVQIHNEIVAKTYTCSAKNTIVGSVWGALIPLAALAPEPQELINYCYKI